VYEFDVHFVLFVKWRVAKTGEAAKF